jgi:hypothetical protein
VETKKELVTLTASLGFEAGKETAKLLDGAGESGCATRWFWVGQAGLLSLMTSSSSGDRHLVRAGLPPPSPVCPEGADRLLLHGYGWHMTEVAETLGVAKSTVQTHAERGMRKLRHKLGVEQ